MAPLSGETPLMLRDLSASWPLVTVQMAEKLTGATEARSTSDRNDGLSAEDHFEVVAARQ